jgi:excisionase family DNA binding protein
MPTKSAPTLIAPRKRAYSAKEAAVELSISLSKVYTLLERKELTGRKAGSRLLILGDEIDRYLNSLPKAVINARCPSKEQREESSAHAG